MSLRHLSALLAGMALISACTDRVNGRNPPDAADENEVDGGEVDSAAPDEGQDEEQETRDSGGATEADASSVLDAGSTLDASSVKADASSVLDAGQASDASDASDGAADASTDASTQSDGGGQAARVLVTDLAAGSGFSCALTVGGSVKCWGDGTGGSLGTGVSVPRSMAAVTAKGLESGVKKIAAAGWNACAIKSDDHVACWGSTGFGILDIPQGGTGNAPVGLTGFADTAIDVAVGWTGNGTTDHVCVVDSSNNIRCAGSNDNYQLGVTAPATSATPVVVAALSGYKAVAAGEGFSCGLTTSGGVKCWGSHYYGTLGDGIIGRLEQPTEVPQQAVGLESGVKQIAATERTACALTDAGGVKCWGSGGALGYGGPGPDMLNGGSGVPVDVYGLTSGVAQITAGQMHFCALLNDGTMRCWGYNQNGQLGNQPANITINLSSWSPVNVVGLSALVAIGAGKSQSCAAPSSGGVLCWGSGVASGSALTTNQIVPAYVTGI